MNEGVCVCVCVRECERACVCVYSFYSTHSHLLPVTSDRSLPQIRSHVLLHQSSFIMVRHGVTVLKYGVKVTLPHNELFRDNAV